MTWKLKGSDDVPENNQADQYGNTGLGVWSPHERAFRYAVERNAGRQTSAQMLWLAKYENDYNVSLKWPRHVISKVLRDNTWLALMKQKIGEKINYF